MKYAMLGVLAILLIWQWRRIRFFALELPAVDTDEVKINGEPWRSYVNQNHFTVGKDKKAADLVAAEIRSLRKDLPALYQLSVDGPARYMTDNLSALIVLEAISRADSRSAFMDKPVFAIR